MNFELLHHVEGIKIALLLERKLVQAGHDVQR